MGLRKQQELESGITSIETVLVISVVLMATMSLMVALAGSQRSNKFIDSDSRIFDHAVTLLERAAGLRFGDPSPPAPAASDLATLVVPENSLFGIDGSQGAINTSASSGNHIGDVTTSLIPINLTLEQLSQISPMIWQYSTPVGGGNSTPLEWRIIVDRDLNGDGIISGPAETIAQSNGDLFRVAVMAGGRITASAIRTRRQL